MGHRYRDCPEEKKPIVCFNCNTEGHAKNDCPHPSRCFNCDEFGHSSKECPKPRDKIICTNCDKEGHRIYDCPDPIDIVPERPELDKEDEKLGQPYKR